MTAEQVQELLRILFASIVPDVPKTEDSYADKRLRSLDDL